MNRTALLVLPLLFLSPSAYAQELQLEAIPPGDTRIEVLRKGEPAPYDGQLFDDATALRWANWLQQASLLYQLDVEAEQKKTYMTTRYYEHRLRLSQEHYNETVAYYSERLKKIEEESRNPPWYRTVWFGAAMGGAAALAVGLGSIWAAGQLK